MIKKILNEVEALSFIKPLINDKIYSNPMLKTEEQINMNLLRVIYDSEDFVIGVYNNEELIGVFSFIIEKEEKYLELLFAYSKDYNAYIEMMNYLNAPLEDVVVFGDDMNDLVMFDERWQVLRWVMLAMN